MLLYCVEINKGASAAPVVRGQPLFTGTWWALFTNIRYEQHLCHEYRAGLGAWRLIVVEIMGESRYEGPWKSSLVLASPQNIILPPTTSSGKVTLRYSEDTIRCRLSSLYAFCMSYHDMENKPSCVGVSFYYTSFYNRSKWKHFCLEMTYCPMIV